MSFSAMFEIVQVGFVVGWAYRADIWFAYHCQVVANVVHTFKPTL